MSAPALEPWYIGAPKLERRGSASRVVASANGQPVWFESQDLNLRPVAEAFAALFFIPALQEGAALHIDAPLHAGWLEQTRRLLSYYTDWWGYPERYPVSCTGTAEPASAPGAGTAQCFTGGVDSFYSLLHGPHEASHLFFVHGYDIPVTDRRRMEAVSTSLHAVAAALGRGVVRLRTNVREHPDFKKAHWERTHGPALAAAGYLASGGFGRLVIPSSYARADERPWGSHPETDPLWSLPGCLDVVHGDTTHSRRDKIVQIAGHPLAQQHLRVCWENRTAAGNCSACEKCLRTMVMLEATGALSHYRVFDTQTPLDERLDALPSIAPRTWFVWDEMRTRPRLVPATRRAIQRLLRRSRRAQGGGRYALYRRVWRLWKRAEAVFRPDR